MRWTSKAEGLGTSHGNRSADPLLVAGFVWIAKGKVALNEATGRLDKTVTESAWMTQKLAECKGSGRNMAETEVRRHPAQGHHPRQPERRPDLREVFARARRPTASPNWTCPASTPKQLLGPALSQRPRRHARALRDRDHPPLHAPVHLELRHRPRHVSAGLLHDEVQRSRQ